MSINMRCSNGDGHEAITMREPVEYEPAIIRLGSNVDLEAHPALAGEPTQGCRPLSPDQIYRFTHWLQTNPIDRGCL
jgi:hypothetical protein